MYRFRCVKNTKCMKYFIRKTDYKYTYTRSGEPHHFSASSIYIEYEILVIREKFCNKCWVLSSDRYVWSLPARNNNDSLVRNIYWGYHILDLLEIHKNNCSFDTNISVFSKEILSIRNIGSRNQ